MVIQTAAEAVIANDDNYTPMGIDFSDYWKYMFQGSPEGPGRTYTIEHDNTIEQITFMYIPEHAIGHKGVVHGGFLATLLDEGLGRCGYLVVPHFIVVTATLELKYNKPTPGKQWIVLRATTKKPETVTRKALVTGGIYLMDEKRSELPWEYGAKPTMEATFFGVEPEWWAKLFPAKL